jgi:hypothetical protein
LIRNRRFANDYERLAQAGETLLEVATIRSLLRLSPLVVTATDGGV